MSGHQIYTAYDVKSERYSEPFFAPTHAVALRIMAQIVNHPTTTHDIKRYPEDFTLFHIGSFSELDGVLVPTMAHTPLGCMIELKEQPAPFHGQQLGMLGVPNENGDGDPDEPNLAEGLAERLAEGVTA